MLSPNYIEAPSEIQITIFKLSEEILHFGVNPNLFNICNGNNSRQSPLVYSEVSTLIFEAIEISILSVNSISIQFKVGKTENIKYPSSHSKIIINYFIYQFYINI